MHCFKLLLAWSVCTKNAIVYCDLSIGSFVDSVVLYVNGLLPPSDFVCVQNFTDNMA